MSDKRGAAWFDVDRSGLAAIAKRRGIGFVATEPVQNAWDEASCEVTVELRPVSGAPLADLTVTDDAPDGFHDITDSYTLFRESKKLDNPRLRGRFNLGEKLILAVATEASVVSTTGSVTFDANGRRRGRQRTAAGSVLRARLRMTRAEIAEALATMRRLIPPPGVTTRVNGDELPQRQPIATFERSLETEVRGEEGGFRYTTRKATVGVYAPLDGEQPSLYEMGIPIDRLDCPWHLDVGQKVPLSVDRASVRWGYLQAIQSAAAEAMAARLEPEQARAAWVAQAIQDVETDEAVRELVEKRFGRAVVYDPSDPEASKRALDAGYHVVRGGELSAGAWRRIRAAEALLPAGKVFRRGQPTSPDGKPPVPHEEWTPNMKIFARYAAEVSAHVLGGEPLAVEFYRLPGSPNLAFCGGGEIGVNLSTGGAGLLERMDEHEIDTLLIHECAHVAVRDHLSDAFHAECCRLGARLHHFHTWLFEIRA